MLTLNSADETDKSDNASMSPQQGSTNLAQVTDADVIRKNPQMTHIHLIYHYHYMKVFILVYKNSIAERKNNL